MCKFTKMLGASFACMFVISAMVAANAAPASRASTGRTGLAAQSARMPSMPVSPINAMGNVAVDKETVPSDVGPQPEPQPDPDPKPDPQPDPDPKPECPDGGVRNSEYGVMDCMNEILSCVNNGALAGGLNDLFNEDMRNAITNGMGLCSVQVDKCMFTVRRDCKPVYRTSADVWIDFNSRKIQPEYYNFVLRKTGLTPNQAENTCMLLDKNTYGPSFAAVANDGLTTAEYNQKVGAYNGQMGNVLIKSNPMGVEVNDGNPGVDGQRGHYARWDATTGTCYLRVAAYNKDKQIKNSWLFGALGNDEAAEVWRPAGDTFSCNKDLFGFSLMKDTNTTALVGVGGGTLLGAGVGALAGHGRRAFDCNNEKHREMLLAQVRADNNKLRLLNSKYLLDDPILSGSSLSETTCDAILDLYDGYEPIAEQAKLTVSSEISCKGFSNLDDCFRQLPIAQSCVGQGFTTVDQCVNFLNEQKIAEVSASTGGELLNEAQVKELRSVFGDSNDKKSLAYLIENGEASNMGKSIGIGAAIGAGTGGVATAITAFVEKNNISCRVGDGLNTVAFGKSHSIDTLKDFYVKWNLRVPDTVMPTTTAVDCKSWKLACAQYTDLNQCKAAAVNYKPVIDGTITLVRSACKVSGSVCIENEVVAKSFGACEE